MCVREECMRECVCVCVRERERERVCGVCCVSVCESVCGVCESVCVWV